MRFVNRKREMATLASEYSSKSSSMVIVYGRRRVGKTRLINEFIKDKDAFVFTATEENERENRKSFKDMLGEYLDNPLISGTNDLSWEIMFKELVRNTGKCKRIIVIDEFQYIGKSNKAFPSIFQKIWDTILMDENVMVILCGSILSLMKSQTLNYSSPLYGRRTAQIKLKQVRYGYYSEFYEGHVTGDLIGKYALTGGVPKYIESLLKYESLKDKVVKIVGDVDGYLYEEPYFLLSREVPDVGSYFSVLKTISNGNVKTVDIATALETKIPNLIHYLNILVDMDILERETPVTERNQSRSKRVMYRIKDNYLNFWFKYVYPNRTLIEGGYADSVADRIIDRMDEELVSYVYERIAQDYVAANWYDMTGRMYGLVGKWWDKREEIDIVAVNENENMILFGECKYRKRKVDMKVYKDLVKKSASVKWGKADRKEEFVLFSKSGFTKDLVALAKANDFLELVVLK